jgi:hypothetical protein
VENNLSNGFSGFHPCKTANFKAAGQTKPVSRNRIFGKTSVIRTFSVRFPRIEVLGKPYVYQIIEKIRKNCYTLNMIKMSMKRNKHNLFLALGILMIGTAAVHAQPGSRVMYVATRDAELKSSTGFFADTVITLQYGDQVTVLRENGKWMEVKPAKRPSVSGWILANSLTSKRIISSGSGTSASADELALAGKGFSEEIEQAYKSRAGGSAANYAEVDAMEAFTVSVEELYRFLVEGHLNTGE